MRIRKRPACISAGFHVAAVQKPQTHNIYAGNNSLSSGQSCDASTLDTQECQKQIVEDHDLSLVCDRKLERAAAIAEQVAPSHWFHTTGSSGYDHRAAKDVFEDSSPSVPCHTYSSMRFFTRGKSIPDTSCDDVHGHDYHLCRLHHASASMQAEKASFLQIDSLPAESCKTRDQLEIGNLNGHTPVCSIGGTWATSNTQLRIQGEDSVSSKRRAAKANQALNTSKKPKCADNGKVGMPTTRATPHLLNHLTSNSSLANEDHMANSSFMSIDKELENTGELQRMCINVMEDSLHCEDQAANLKILAEERDNFKKINNDRSSATRDEDELKQDQGTCKEKRCSRKGGGGWQCKNMRPGDGSSVYCNYHQVLTSAQHRATFNARNKISKEIIRKRRCTVAEKSDQPLQNMVDVKLLQLPFLPFKEHTYKDAKAYDTVSSMGSTTFKRTFQAAGCAEKQQPVNLGKDDVEPASTSAALPGLVEADIPTTQHPHQEADPKFEGCIPNFKKRRAGNATVILEAGECSILSIMMNGEKCATDKVVGANDATGGKIDKLDDGNEISNEVEEIMRCKQIDGRGVQCIKPSLKFCEYHFNEVHRQESLKECSAIDIKHNLSLTNINLASAGKHSDALMMVTSSSNVQDSNSSDPSKSSQVIMANAINVVDECHVNSSIKEKKSVQARERLDRDQMQGDGLHNKHDKSANELHQQLQQQQLWWWQCKQHDKDGVVNTEHPQLHLLPRRSERKLIIDICKATAAEKLTKDLNVEAKQSEFLQNHSSKPPDILEHSTSIEPMDKMNAVPPVFHANETSRSHSTQQQQCKRHDGRGWQCKTMCAQGKLYCEHHLKLRRSYVEKGGVETNNRLQTQPCKEQNNIIEALNYSVKMGKRHGIKKQMQCVTLQAGNDKPEAVNAPQKELVEWAQQCGRHDGRGWQCKSKCRQGSVYCEYHQEKLRLNHATWNAKVKLLQQRKKEEAIMHNKREAQEQSPKRSMEEMAEEGSLFLAKKKMRSLKDIEACAIT